MEMTGSFVISMAANTINPALPCRSAVSSAQSICHCRSAQPLKDRHVTASVFTTTITRRSLTTHASNMCGCVSIDLYASGLNFWTWLWAAKFLLGIIMEISLCVSTHCLSAIKTLRTCTFCSWQPYWAKKSVKKWNIMSLYFVSSVYHIEKNIALWQLVGKICCI